MTGLQNSVNSFRSEHFSGWEQRPARRNLDLSELAVLVTNRCRV